MKQVCYVLVTTCLEGGGRQRAILRRPAGSRPPPTANNCVNKTALAIRFHQRLEMPFQGVCVSFASISHSTLSKKLDLKVKFVSAEPPVLLLLLASNYDRSIDSSIHPIIHLQLQWSVVYLNTLHDMHRVPWTYLSASSVPRTETPCHAIPPPPPTQGTSLLSQTSVPTPPPPSPTHARFGPPARSRSAPPRGKATPVKRTFSLTLRR